jgi:hypothetical protein
MGAAPEFLASRGIMILTDDTALEQKVTFTVTQE